MEEEAVKLNIIDGNDIKIVKIIRSAYIGDDDAGGAYAEGCSGLCGPVDREIRGNVGQLGCNRDGATRPGLVCNIEDDEVGGGAIGGGLVNGITEGTGPAVSVGGHGECGGQGRKGAS